MRWEALPHSELPAHGSANWQRQRFKYQRRSRRIFLHLHRQSFRNRLRKRKIPINMNNQLQNPSYLNSMPHKHLPQRSSAIPLPHLRAVAVLLLPDPSVRPLTKHQRTPHPRPSPTNHTYQTTMLHPTLPTPPHPKPPLPFGSPLDPSRQPPSRTSSHAVAHGRDLQRAPTTSPAAVKSSSTPHTSVRMKTSSASRPGANHSRRPRRRRGACGRPPRKVPPKQRRSKHRL